MRISTRTGIAAGISTAVALAALSIGVSLLFRASASQRVDDLLRERAEAAPIFAAVAERVAVSELDVTLDGVRVDDGSRTVSIGRLPDDPLPPLDEPALRTVRADDENWRLLAVRVDDVPRVGDRALVEFVEPLGDVDEQVRTLRRRTIGIAIVTGVVVALFGAWWGRRAARPLTDLAEDANRIDPGRPAEWSVRTRSGSPEVDDVAQALNRSLEALAAQTERTEDALAAARAFGASASHELRTPLQSALTNLDVASASGHGGAEVDAARDELRRAAERLSAVRALSAVDLVSAAEFVEHDLVELVDRVLAGFTGRFESVDLLGADHVTIRGWPEGISLAIENVVRNASVHANPGESVALVVRVATDATVTIDDDGSGIGADERARLLGRYERGSTSAAGSGLGLTLAARVSAAHGGSLVLDDSPTGGLRAILRFS